MPEKKLILISAAQKRQEGSSQELDRSRKRAQSTVQTKLIKEQG